MKRLVFLVALLFASPANAQSLTLGNLKTPIARICGTTPATSIKQLWAQINGCPAAHTMPTPTPTPTPSPAPTPTPPSFVETTRIAAELVPIDSGLPWESITTPQAIPPSNAPDVVGAFRFPCAPSHANYDDPIVFPGKPGMAHLHRFFGNTLANGMSNYKSLRTTGDSTCMSKANRSSYWIPAMLDGKGTEIVPNLLAFYYKQRPPEALRARGDLAADRPHGLRLIAGWNYATPSAPQPVLKTWKCVDLWTPLGNGFETLPEALETCRTAPPSANKKIMVSVDEPGCWNGKDLDDPADHRSHMAFEVKYADGIMRCPRTHPYGVPAGILTVEWTYIDGEDTSGWHLSSDHMGLPGTPRGGTMHIDTYAAHEPRAQLAWHRGCIDKLLSCASGNFGNGTGMAWDFAGKGHPHGTVVPRLVPIPAHP